MKRDPDLVRAILLAVEAAPGAELLRMPIPSPFDRPIVHYHVRLLIEGGYLIALRETRYRGPDWLCLRLSWSGYDYLGAVRDPKIWRLSKQGARTVGSWSLETLGTIAKSIIQSRIVGIEIGQAL